MGLATLTANTDGTIQTGTKITAVSADAVAKKEFDASTVAANSMDLGANHGLKAGDEVVYNKGTGTLIGGLTEGKTYYVILDGTTKVKLAATKGGTAIDLTPGSGTQSLTTAKAAPVSGGGSLGIGASVGLNIANTTAIAELSDTAKLLGTINGVTLSADSISTQKTTSTAGGMAAGGSGVGIGGAISITVANTETKAFIGSGDALILGGDLSATATHTGSTLTKADGAASGGAAAVGIALGLNVVNDSTLSTTNRTITAGGAVTFAAHASASTAAEAKASAAGAEEEDKKKTDAAAAKKTFDAGTKVDLAANTIDLGANHGLKTGDAVVYSKGTGTVIGVLEDGKTYYVITDGPSKVKLATTAANANKGTFIDLTTAGTGSDQSLTPDTSKGVDNQVNAQKGLADKKAKEGGTKEFDPSAKVDEGADTIDLGANHGLKTGDAVVYSKGTGTVIGGLEEGKTYYVITEGATKVKLASECG